MMISDPTDFMAEIIALREAVASGARTVSYDGKSVSYDDFTGMLRRLNWLESLLTGMGKSKAGFATFNRG